MTDGLHPVLAARGTFEGMPLGRAEVYHDPRTLRLANYLDDAVVLPEIPEQADWTANVATWPMYANDRLGDCTIAAAGHMVQSWTAAASSPREPAEQDILDAYDATGSGDTGRFEVDVLNYWRNTGIGGDRIAAYAYLDPQNLDHVHAAIWLFGGVYAGVALPNTAKGQTVWDVDGDPSVQGSDAFPGSWGGHAVPFLGYGAGHLATVTWGATLNLTDAFHLAYTDELYVPLSADFLKGDVNPAGFDLAALQADLAVLTGAATPPPAPAAATDPGGYTWNG